MREAFARELVARFGSDPNCFLLTVDVGFRALEPVREAFGGRFINAGVAEQNLIGVAAGLAREGLRVFCYSIAPFLYARPFEQIRNDLGFTGLPVCLVGNGGGYAYGAMGPTHHALEDCAAMAALGVRAVVPAFDTDVGPFLDGIAGPTYLRLGRDERPDGYVAPPPAAWRRVLEGGAGVLVALGPLTGTALQAFAQAPVERRPVIWSVTECPGRLIPEAFWGDIHERRLCVCEEHVAAGGLGMMVAHAMALRGVRPAAFTHRAAQVQASGPFGSQEYHRAHSGLDIAGLRAEFPSA